MKIFYYLLGVLPDTLPDHHETALVAYLRSLQTDSIVNRASEPSEAAIHVLWCPIISYSVPTSEFPGCVFITTERVQIFRVLQLHGDNGIPRLRLLYHIPLPNIQQIAIGYESLYLQIEESFLGSAGTFTLLTMNATKTDRFVDSVKRAYRYCMLLYKLSCLFRFFYLYCLYGINYIFSFLTCLLLLYIYICEK